MASARSNIPELYRQSYATTGELLRAGRPDTAGSETDPASQHEFRLGSDVRICRADSLIVWGDSSGIV
jgi:hypothetical protein